MEENICCESCYCFIKGGFMYRIKDDFYLCEDCYENASEVFIDKEGENND